MPGREVSEDDARRWVARHLEREAQVERILLWRLWRRRVPSLRPPMGRAPVRRLRRLE